MRAIGAALTLTRRDVLRMATVGGASAFVAGCVSATAPRGNVTPEEALRILMDGNARYASGQMTSFDEDLELIRQHNETRHQPFAALLACADARIPVEMVFDQTLGRLFVTRVAGNIATSEIIASLEYGVIVLGAKVIMVLGHGSCGAVSATISGKAAPGRISSLYAPIQPAVNEAGPNLDASIRANARIQAKQLREGSPVLAELIQQGKLRMVAAYYDLTTGKVTLLA